MKGTVYPRPSVKDGTGAKRPVKGSTWTYAFSVTTGAGRRQITKGGFRTKRDAEAALAEALTEHGQGGPAKVEPSKMALATYLRSEWLPTLHGLKPKTRSSYAELVDAYVVPTLVDGVPFGDQRLCDLTPGMVSKLYDELRTNGRRRPKKDGSRALAESTVHHVHVVVSSALGHAVEVGLLRTSPIVALPKKHRPKQPAKSRPEMHVWTAEQARTFLAKASTDRLVGMYDLALNTGLRRGELVALRWADVDLERSVLAVRHSTVTVGYEAVDGTPKSDRARTIDIDEGTVAALKAHRRRQLEERMAWGEAWTDTGLVFTREDGTALHPQTALWHLRRLSRTAGVPEIRLHDLRHTHATLGLAAGVPPKVMQERLGHASVQITIDLYSHVVPGMQADAAAKIGALLRSSPA